MSYNEISFFLKKEQECPACKYSFKREVMRVGGGRLNSIKLETDLRRVFLPSKKYGEIFPIIYDIIVCPKCWFAALEDDFTEKKFAMEKIKELSEQRKIRGMALIKNNKVNYEESRNLYAGLLSYYLAIHCYHFLKKQEFSEFYKGLFALRASWCSKDLARTFQDDDFLYTVFYFRYLAALNYDHYASSVENKILDEDIKYYGPDCDYDFGFKGMIYLSSVLGVEFSELIHEEKDRLDFYRKKLQRLSKIFGIGKITKNSPSPFLTNVHNTYDQLKEKVKKLENETI